MNTLSNTFSAAQNEADAYTRAILELLGDRDPLVILRELPAALEMVLDGVEPERLRRPEGPGKWSMIQVVQHLADSEVVWAWRLRLVVAADQPAMTGYDQDRWAARLKYEAVPMDLALDQLRTMRRVNLWFLDQLSEQERQRVGVHSERGEESVEHMIRLYAGHDLAHRRQLERIRGS